MCTRPAAVAARFAVGTSPIFFSLLKQEDLALLLSFRCLPYLNRLKMSLAAICCPGLLGSVLVSELFERPGRVPHPRAVKDDLELRCLISVFCLSELTEAGRCVLLLL